MAAKKTDRQPVLLLSVESVDGISCRITTKTDWDSGSVKTNINTGSSLDDPGVVIMATDGAEAHSGVYAASLVYIFDQGYAGNDYDDRTRSVVMDCPNSRTVSVAVTVRYNVSTPSGIIGFYPETSLDGSSWTAGPTQWPPPSPWSASPTTTLNFPIPKGHLHVRIQSVVPGDEGGTTATSYFDHTMSYETLYLASAFTHTISVDLGTIPDESSIFGVEDITSVTATLVYTARGSNDNSTWSELGTVVDGGLLPPYRYYDFTASFTSTGMVTPLLREITVTGGNSQYERYSTHEDIPVAARPLLINSLGTVGNKLELMKLGSTGEVSPKLFYRRETFELLRDGKLRNKYVSIKHGFLGLAETEFQPLFAGLWYDGSIDLYRHEITVKTRTILARFQKAKIPKEITPEGETRTDLTVPPVEWQEINIITVMLDIISYLGIQSRYIDMVAANAIRSGARSGPDWVVSRRLDKDNKEEATKLLEELSVLAGVFIIPRSDGVMTFKLYDPSEAIQGEITTDIATFSLVEMGQAELFTRQHIYYEPRHENDLQTGIDQGEWVPGLDVSRNDSVNISDVTWFCLLSHLTSVETAPGTGVASRAYWATIWADASDYVVGDVRISRGPLYTCKQAHTSSTATEPGHGSDWRAYWIAQPIKSGDSASDFHSSYVLINQTAEVDWGLNKDVPPSDPDYQTNPGYQKQWFDKWNASPAAIAALAERMDAWFANPKMRLKASDLPPEFFDQTRYQVGNFVGVTGLLLPAAGAEWGQLTDKKKFMIMSNPFDPAKCTVSFDLLEV